MHADSPPPVPALPDGVRSRRIANGNGLTMHVLEAGRAGQPLIVLLHGFPELTYTWRHVLPSLAAAGYHAVAPDQRGYGHTTGWDGDYDGDLASYRPLNLVRDVLGLTAALGYRSVAAVVGHDMGSTVAGWCAIARPDVFRSAVFMSAPFAGAPAFPFNTADTPPRPADASAPDLDARLAALDPPRRHYQHYFRGRAADTDMRRCPQGIHAFLLAYFHMKSGDWDGNAPRPLASMAAAELARMPGYYIMARDHTMPQTVAPAMPSVDAIARCQWLPDAALAVYSDAFEHTGFQGGLQWYRAFALPAYQAELYTFSGRAVTQPACFIAGDRDWGVYQAPGRFERMHSRGCTDMRGCHLVPGAGHWVQQEAPDAVNAHLLAFLGDAVPATA
ncbi:alpha/beta fold hydrolase [Aquisalimonas asiatica]|uniref:Pimeloyl-ACP methyl ester carboxylesterase n=1 Tax=Aquisalimonas asiatica TaxID=406100 RepID=A0A1H8TJU4_9GAMM|nr:alpha/beta fold hydrolase [Aquisalimonas asiatica]SEO90768.1 Pimeloyl-ACP methyl ester carboxylesterase [Aquisalimonas asiatica]